MTTIVEWFNRHQGERVHVWVKGLGAPIDGFVKLGAADYIAIETDDACRFIPIERIDWWDLLL